MGQGTENIGVFDRSPVIEPCRGEEPQDAGEARLLLRAFEMFTQASGSLETAFSQLEERARKLTEELEAKNLELEHSLREKEEAQNYLKTILERLPCGVLVIDSGGNAALCNPAAYELLGQTPAVSCSLGTPAGSTLTAGMRERLTASAGVSDTNVEGEISIVSGDKKRILATSWAPLSDAAGIPLGTLHIIRDVTEVKALQEKNKRVERLSAMGEMAVELAHEIRNPLGSIELFASLLVRDLTGGSKRWAESIRIGIRSLNTIVSNMLQFANPILPAFADVDLHDIIREVLGFSEPLTSQREMDVQARLDAKDPVIRGDALLLRQMMLNLLFNAMKAMPTQGALTIRTRTVDRAAGSRGLELQVRDTGIGIPEENLSRIFDPFFTTDKRGTGLGLSVVHQIVEKHSGRIGVASELNRGTTFTIQFPCRAGKE